MKIGMGPKKDIKLVQAVRESIGDDVANYILRTSSIRGTRVHKLVDSFLCNESIDNMTSEYGVTAAGLFNLMRPALEKINNIVTIEKAILANSFTECCIPVPITKSSAFLC